MGNAIIRHVLLDKSARGKIMSVRPSLQVMHFWPYRRWEPEQSHWVVVYDQLAFA